MVVKDFDPPGRPAPGGKPLPSPYANPHDALFSALSTTASSLPLRDTPGSDAGGAPEHTVGAHADEDSLLDREIPFALPNTLAPVGLCFSDASSDADEALGHPSADQPSEDPASRRPCLSEAGGDAEEARRRPAADPGAKPYVFANIKPYEGLLRAIEATERMTAGKAPRGARGCSADLLHSLKKHTPDWLFEPPDPGLDPPQFILTTALVPRAYSSHALSTALVPVRPEFVSLMPAIPGFIAFASALVPAGSDFAVKPDKAALAAAGPPCPPAGPSPRRRRLFACLPDLRPRPRGTPRPGPTAHASLAARLLPCACLSGPERAKPPKGREPRSG